jgi:hypothetical protein
MYFKTVPNISQANKPKITDGIAANSSIATRTLFWYLTGKRYLMNVAVFVPTGAAIIMAKPETKIVIHSGNQNDALLAVVSKLLPKILQP